MLPLDQLHPWRDMHVFDLKGAHELPKAAFARVCHCDRECADTAYLLAVHCQASTCIPSKPVEALSLFESDLSEDAQWPYFWVSWQEEKACKEGDDYQKRL